MMPKFVFAYHGGATPETPEEGEKVMTAWRGWMQGMGDKLADGGNPVGMSQTVTASGVEANGGANPLSGYSLVNAGSMSEALEMAKGCPILASGGTVEVAEAIEM